MTTMVGLQEDFQDALIELCELDYDAVEAYKAAIERVKGVEFKKKLGEFKEDHERHIQEISTLLSKHKVDIPTGPSAKQLITKSKVVLANLLGDKAILKAMLSNEADTNKAYERLNQHSKKWAEAEATLTQGWKDEKRHKLWIENALQTLAANV